MLRDGLARGRPSAARLLSFGRRGIAGLPPGDYGDSFPRHISLRP